MAGFWDLLAFVLGWKSAAPGGVAGPYRLAVGTVWQTGALLGANFVTGSQAGQTFCPASVIGQIHG